MTAWRSLWAGRSTRERGLLGLAAFALAALLIWSLALAPALKTLATAPAALEQLDARIAAMQLMASEAALLKQRSAPARGGDAVRQLEASVPQRLGPGAGFSSSADRITVTLQAAQPEPLAQWLVQARESAGAVAEQASLRQGANGWEGRLVLRLPPTP